MTISIIGFGDFGRLATKYLAQQAEVLVYSRDDTKNGEVVALGARPVSITEAANTDVIILAVNLDVLESTLTAIAPHLKPGALVADVTSVKLKPVEMMQRLLPDSVQILATHPLFGPQSAAESLAGHKIVIEPIRVTKIAEVESFLADLGLEVVHMTADEHDREMAWVHALTFFVGRGLLNINPPASPLATNYYNELMDVVNLEKTQSMDLFYTIQRGNPYADDMRKKIISSLNELEKKIQQ